MRFFINSSRLLTVQDLQGQLDSYDLGYWRLPVNINGNKLEIIIVGRKINGIFKDYTVSISSPLHILGHGQTLKQAVRIYNSFVVKAQREKTYSGNLTAFFGSAGHE